MRWCGCAGRRGDRGGVGDVELDRGRSVADLRPRLPRPSQVARSDEDGDAVRDEFFGDLQLPTPWLAPVTRAMRSTDMCSPFRLLPIDYRQVPDE